MLTKKEQIQEEQYVFPYHYLDLAKSSYSNGNKIIFNYWMNHLRKKVIDIISPSNGQLILDAGCGDGRFCFDAKKYNVKIEGVDYSPSAIRYARCFNPDVRFYL